MGNVLQSGLGQNPARQALLKSGLSDTVCGFTVNKVCGSGLKSVALAALAIKAGQAQAIVAGGMENMSLAPYLLDAKARWGYRLGDGQLSDVILRDGLICAEHGYHMGITAENVAKEYGISREMQDELALQSQRKARCRNRDLAHLRLKSCPSACHHGRKPSSLSVTNSPKLTRRQQASPHCVQPLIKQEPSPQVTPRGSTTVQRH